MNYYFRRDTEGYVGNVYATSSEDAEKKVYENFGYPVERVELLEENVKTNRFTKEKY